MVSRRRVRRVGPVAVETLGTHMAPFTGLRPGIGNRTMNLGEILAVRGRPLSLGTSASASARTRHREHLHRTRLPEMTREAALLGVTGGAGAGRLAGRATVPKQELGIPVIGWRFELSLDRGGPKVQGQSLDHRHLGSIHMALDAEITSMAGSAGRGNLEGCRRRSRPACHVR